MKKLLAMTAMSLGAMTAQAQDVDVVIEDGVIAIKEPAEPAVKGEKGFFVQGVAIVGSTYELDGDALDKTTGLGLKFGYQFNKHIALEVSEMFQGEGSETDQYCELGYCERTVANFEAQTTQIGVKLTAPLREDNIVALMARVGIAASIAEFSGSEENAFLGETISFSEDMFGFGNYIGVGVQVRPNDHLLLSMDYTIQQVSYEFEDSLFEDAVGDLDIDNKALNIGVGYQW